MVMFLFFLKCCEVPSHSFEVPFIRAASVGAKPCCVGFVCWTIFFTDRAFMLRSFWSLWHISYRCLHPKKWTLQKKCLYSNRIYAGGTTTRSCAMNTSNLVNWWFTDASNSVPVSIDTRYYREPGYGNLYIDHGSLYSPSNWRSIFTKANVHRKFVPYQKPGSIYTPLQNKGSSPSKWKETRLDCSTESATITRRV